jgi:myo-inositol-1(or 4)-monophosphatase
MMDLDPIVRAAESGGRVLSKYFGKKLEITEKLSTADFRTRADLDSENEILKILKKAFPKFNILTEESGTVDNGSDYTFIIDPLDGSNNFILGLPTFTVSIGLMNRNEVVAGVIHHPVLNHTYYAQKGAGAFLDKKRLHVNNESDLTRATVEYTCGYMTPDGYGDKLIRNLHGMKIKRFMNTWCPSYTFCLLAMGKIECIINNDNEVYDYCAGKIIAKEAGAKITDFEGKPETDEKANIFLATNGTAIHNKILGIV